MMVTRRIGLIENEVIPFIANANIFLSGYFDSPAARLSLSYVTILLLKADQVDNATQKQIDLPVFFKAVKGPSAHQAVISVVENHIHAHGSHEFVKAFGRRTF
jgi:hypothetical protein